MWIARDKNGRLYLFFGKPSKSSPFGRWSGWGECFYYDDKDNDFADVKWSDDEPTEVKLIKK